MELCSLLQQKKKTSVNNFTGLQLFFTLQYPFSNTDTCAAMNLGRILAIRCLQSGIYFAKPGVTKNELDRSKHVSSLLISYLSLFSNKNFSRSLKKKDYN